MAIVPENQQKLTHYETFITGRDGHSAGMV